MSICIDKRCCRHHLKTWIDAAGSHKERICCNCGDVMKTTVKPSGTAKAYTLKTKKHGPFLPTYETYYGTRASRT